MCDIWPSPQYNPKPPPVREGGKASAGIFIQAMVEIIARQVDNNHNKQGGWPVPDCSGNDGLEDHDGSIRRV